MSENLDLVRAIFAEWERGDYSSTDWAHADIEFVVADGTDPGVCTGLARMAGAWGEVLSLWEDLRSKADDYRALDDERVLALLTWTGRARRSGFDRLRQSVRRPFTAVTNTATIETASPVSCWR